MQYKSFKAPILFSGDRQTAGASNFTGPAGKGVRHYLPNQLRKTGG